MHVVGFEISYPNQYTASGVLFSTLVEATHKPPPLKIIRTMSDNGSGLNGRGSTVEIPFELQLALGEIEYTDDVAAAFITAVWQMSNSDHDESPPPSRSWLQQFHRRNRAASQVEAQDRASRSDSDSSSEPQDRILLRRYQLSSRELHLIYQALLQTSIDESTRDILVVYFGDRFRSIPVRPHAPRQAVEAPENPFTNTSLIEPEMEPSSNRRPVSQRAEAARDRAREQQQEFQTRMEVASAQIAERNEQHRLARVSDSRATAFRAHRDSPEHQRLLNELECRAQEFARNDPEAYNQWNEHRRLSRLATDSPARQHQMMLWYTQGPEGAIHDASRWVPSSLFRQIIRVERWYTRLARLEWRLHRAEMEDESRASMSDTDNDLAGSPSYEPVGFESGESGLGFENYSPRHNPNTQAELLLANVSANFSTRRIRLLHAPSAEDFAILLARMQSFILQALETFEHLELIGETDPQLPEDFLQRVADERSLLITFQEEGMEYDDPSGDVGSSDEERNASDIEDEFPDGMPTAIENARSLEEDEETDDEQSGDEGQDETGEHSEEQNQEQRNDQSERQEGSPDEQHGPSPPQQPALEDEDLYGYSGDER